MKRLKKEIALQTGAHIPVRMKKGVSSGMLLYGNLFYNRRKSALSDEEAFFEGFDFRGATVIDAGAHLGVYTLYFGRQAEGGRVLAFEPNPLTFRLLKKNIGKNRIGNALAVNAGLSNREDTLTYVSRRYNFEKGTFKTDKQEIMRSGRGSLVELQVPVTTIDRAVKEHALSRLDFVKIDTEGFEPFVVEGMRHTLEVFRPVVYLEVHGLTEEQKRGDLRRAAGVLREYDYHVYRLKEGLPEAILEGEGRSGAGAYVAFSGSSERAEKALEHWRKTKFPG
jgi:FkbM family methyltransferase